MKLEQDSPVTRRLSNSERAKAMAKVSNAEKSREVSPNKRESVKRRSSIENTSTPKKKAPNTPSPTKKVTEEEVEFILEISTDSEKTHTTSDSSESTEELSSNSPHSGNIEFTPEVAHFEKTLPPVIRPNIPKENMFTNSMELRNNRPNNAFLNLNKQESLYPSNPSKNLSSTFSFSDSVDSKADYPLLNYSQNNVSTTPSNSKPELSPTIKNDVKLDNSYGNTQKSPAIKAMDYIYSLFYTISIVFIVFSAAYITSIGNFDNKIKGDIV